jgi:DNA polymerase-3 subunit epsilon
MTQSSGNDLEELARKLDHSENYRVIRRLIPREATVAPEGYVGKHGIILDFETTGLDYTKDEIIEIGMVKFRYSDADEITGVSGIFQSFNQPSDPIAAEITELTGIMDDMVAGCEIDAGALEAFVSDVNIVIAHNASFDRKFAERFWDLFVHKPWACSATGVEWRKRGFEGSRLSYLLSGVGYFHDKHRAVDDCQALMEILSHIAHTVPESAFRKMMREARRPRYRIWAEHSPFEFKDELKRRSYRWNDGSDGRPRSWYLDIDEDGRVEAIRFLRQEIYQREIDPIIQKLTALNRFSDRA